MHELVRVCRDDGLCQARTPGASSLIDTAEHGHLPLCPGRVHLGLERVALSLRQRRRLGAPSPRSSDCQQSTHGGKGCIPPETLYCAAP
jgi:hypothetical protein